MHERRPGNCDVIQTAIIIAWSPTALWPEVGNVTSKWNGVTRFRSSHVLRAITIKSYNVTYEPIAIILRSDNDFNNPRAITLKSGKFLQSVEALCDNSKM
jgi:hypothetical protein